MCGCDSEFVSALHTTYSFEGLGPSFDLSLMVRKGELESQVAVDDGVELEGDGSGAVTSLK